MTRDVRFAFRSLRRRPAVGAGALLCLALGIGATSLVFSLVDALWWSPVHGVRQPDRLVSLAPRPFSLPGMEGASFRQPLSRRELERLREASRSFTSLGAFLRRDLNAAVGERALRVPAALVSDGLFATLGVEPAAGRLPGSPRAGEGDEVVLAAGLAERFFGDAESSLGRRLRVNAHPFTVVGVTPAVFRGPWVHDPVELWLPASAAAALDPPGDDGEPAAASFFWIFGRLADGVSLEAARQELDALAGHLGEDEPLHLDAEAGIGHRVGTREQLAAPLAVLAAAVALVLLMACVNVTNLLVVQALERRHELSVRRAVGATRGRLWQQILAENLTVCFVGGALGTAFAALAARGLEGLRLAQYLTTLPPLRLNPRVLALDLAVVLVVGLVVASAVAWGVAGRGAAGRDLPSGGRGGSVGARGSALVVAAQVAMALVLITATTLLVRSLLNLQRVDPGFSPRGVLSLRLDLDAQGYSPPAGRAFWQELRDRAARLPLVDSATVALATPLTTGDHRVIETTLPGSDDSLWLPYNPVGPEYFDTLGIPLLAGRGVDAEDRPGRRDVAVLDRALARRLFGDTAAAVGRRLTLGSREHLVVGVAGDVHATDLTTPPEGQLYLALAQHYEPVASLQARAARGDAVSLLAPLQREVAALDRTLPAFDVTALPQVVARASAQQRWVARVLSAFTVAALALCLLGIFAVTYQAVQQRRSELGIRLALGADHGTVVRGVVGRVGRIVGLGVAAGLVGCLVLLRSLEGLLYGVRPLDPGVLLAATFAVVLVAAAAALGPALSTVRIDPAEVLRVQ